MKKEYKNFWYMLAWVIIATLLLNPTFANQISSNLVKWFVAITSTDTKSENNLVWLDAGWKLPTDIIPASAATAPAATWIPQGYCQTTMIQKSEISNATISCGTWWTPLTMSAYWRSHPTGISTPSWSSMNVSQWDWQNNRYVLTQCCVPAL